MAFSDHYRPILDELHDAVVAEWGLSEANVYMGSPGLEINIPHAIIAPQRITTDRNSEYGTGRKPAGIFTVTVRGEFAITASTQRPIDLVFDQVDALCFAIETNATFGTMGMMPLVEEVGLDEITGEMDGSGQRRTVVEMVVSFVVQRARG
jgi:hypothetical protein